MRKVININRKWAFAKESEIPAAVPEKWNFVNLPHTWNAIDGQDGENDYYRGTCCYVKEISKDELPEADRYYLEFRGANSSASVYVGGKKLASHDGGYSTWRVDITENLESKTLIAVTVDNSPNETVYPQMADFTFYGGLYRDVNIIAVSNSHFDLDYYGAPGIKVTPTVDGKDAQVEIETYLTGAKDGQTVEYTITDSEGAEVTSAVSGVSDSKAVLEIKGVNLWHGRKNPYLYTAEAKLVENGEVIDEVSDKFGFREFYFDSEKGFFLNGNHLKLKGVSRHQDWENIGNALTIEEHKKDIELIKDIGANSIRLAHYQHDSKFYDLCDEEGFLVWAEIPVISRFSKKKQEQAKFMLEELIRQNYNHPSIFCWSIANEITIGGATSGVAAGIRELNDIAHCLDSTRPTATAQVTFSSMNSKLNDIPDILGYNQYFGWYIKTVDGIDEWLDKFHEKKPEIKLCISEYGAEGVTTLHSAKPVQGDYSEEYQAFYHEHYVKALSERDWLWGSYVWNMFDFGSAIRNEGGVRGRNNKGLVTIDRKIKKDAYYVYKAYWSDKKFVHIAGERFVDRPTGEQKIKVYSNCPKVTLTVNGESTELEGDKIFEFDAVIKEGENVITAKSGRCSHKITVNGTDIPNPDYVLPEGGETFVRNWFSSDDEINPDNLSLNDSLGDILFNDEIQKLIKNHAHITLDSPALKPLGKIPLKPISKLASKLGAGEAISMANQFLQTIEKDKK